MVGNESRIKSEYELDCRDIYKDYDQGLDDMFTHGARITLAEILEAKKILRDNRDSKLRELTPKEDFEFPKIIKEP